MPRTSRTSRRALALFAVVAVVVIGLAVGVAPSHTSVPTPVTVHAATASPGLTAARQSCGDFASLVGALQAGEVGPSQLSSAVTGISSSADSAAAADRSTWGKLAADAASFASAISTNDPTTSSTAKTFATDCQAALTAPAST